MKAITPDLLEFLSSYDEYIIAGHKEPDGDCIGSCLAMRSFLARRGKKTRLVSAGPFKRPEIKQYEHLFVTKIDMGGSVKADPAPSTALIVLDCSDIARLGDASIGLEQLPRTIIDHHATNSESAKTSLVDSTSPSTTLLVQAIIEAADGQVTKEEAQYLLFGLCTDTGFFRHLDDRSSETFVFASRLVAAGGNPKQTFAHMNGGKSFASRVLLARILARMQNYYNGALVVSWETLEETNEFGQEGRDSDTLYQLIQGIAGVEAIVIVRQETETNCTVGFRSLDRIDVSAVAASFGGGGHRQASGLSIAGTIEELIPRFVKAFESQFSTAPA